MLSLSVMCVLSSSLKRASPTALRSMRPGCLADQCFQSWPTTIGGGKPTARANLGAEGCIGAAPWASGTREGAGWADFQRAGMPENDVDALLPAWVGESLPSGGTGLDAHEDSRTLAVQHNRPVGLPRQLHRAHEHLVAVGGNPRGEASQELRQYLHVGLLALLRRELGLFPGLGALRAVPGIILGIPPRDEVPSTYGCSSGTDGVAASGT